ncbi:hemagglutinin protein [Ichthyenterobacterium magnum]|uniref:Uncharacterized protein n=1 Tax=Ichthyenterobacterium magnum TaxID=1230530 RepID=A0A420DL42_9FLAO|nr:hemagglutinin protein [Ichthyenterobacterium magnum]RKE94901.1 hypothetical protein BXY80_1914 [Ichthyenterobacterium magnum]
MNLRICISTLVILFIQSLVNAQSIEKFSIDAGGASTTVGGIEILYTIGEVNVQEYSTPSFSVSEGFINANLKISIDPKVFLQGPSLNASNPGLMNDILRSDDKLPVTSPYQDLVVINASVLNDGGTSGFGGTSDDIVDWVWVELRAANDNTKMVNGRSALLQRDGDVVDLDGLTNLTMHAAPTNYYVVVKHRNHLGVMSASTIGLSSNSVAIVDFKNSGFSTFGTNAQIQLTSGDMALWAGDVNNDGVVQYVGDTPDSPSILSFVLNDIGNVLNLPTHSVSGYYTYDVNLNGTTQYSGLAPDTPFILQNVLSHPGNSILNLSTYKIEEQLPEH